VKQLNAISGVESAGKRAAEGVRRCRPQRGKEPSTYLRAAHLGLFEPARKKSLSIVSVMIDYLFFKRISVSVSGRL
jgi:hypothetical protein